VLDLIEAQDVCRHHLGVVHLNHAGGLAGGPRNTDADHSLVGLEVRAGRGFACVGGGRQGRGWISFGVRAVAGWWCRKAAAVCGCRGIKGCSWKRLWRQCEAVAACVRIVVLSYCACAVGTLGYLEQLLTAGSISARHCISTAVIWLLSSGFMSLVGKPPNQDQLFLHSTHLCMCAHQHPAGAWGSAAAAEQALEAARLCSCCVH